ncbi:response regulator transcription factor [Nibribacter koreensis]|uniref:Response regulatory domain-containing protein n=1 Tax=Nibribacter koreensis TaxID=1084519 RepID=A0ABP8F6Q9_9BACT
MAKILVIEDEQMMLKALEFRLKKDGHQVLVASNGKEAMTTIESNQLDLILTDIMLPFASGLEIINYSKNILNRPTAIIILSAVGLEKTVLEAFELGADDFITKPFSPNELSVRVKKILLRTKS